jgi:hypothetical protein
MKTIVKLHTSLLDTLQWRHLSNFSIPIFLVEDESTSVVNGALVGVLVG